MRRTETGLPGVAVIEPRVSTDHRGFFLESYNQRALAELGITAAFVQDNHSRSRQGVLRGLHYQIVQPQAKLVRVTVGRVFDVAVDIRRGSPSFGRWTGVELTADNFRQLFVPAGFAHGFLVLSEVAEFQYKCSDFWCADGERGIAWDDPAIGIDWPLDGIEPILSDKDRANPSLDQMPAADLPVLEAPDHG